MNVETDKPSRASRWVGGLLFAVGMAMLIVVFGLAATAFMEVPEALAAGGQASAAGLAPALAGTAARVGFLLVMAYVSSLFASKGLELYEAARGRDKE